MNKAWVIYQLTEYFGLEWIVFRLTYALKLRFGYLRRILPAYEWSQRPLSYWLRDGIPVAPEMYVEWRRSRRGRFFFDQLPGDYPFGNSEQLIAAADSILEGIWPYFSGKQFNIGMPPDWHLNPLTGQSVPAEQHWTRISDFDSGDIKYIWEASRFSVVYVLVRAYTASRDAKYAAAYWQLVDDWAKHNPPQQGPNWKCGQEATFRVMAWCFGLYAFGETATPVQIGKLVGMIAAHGERIEKNISYARSQNNNHGVSEGVGLWTIGVLFPELKRAEHWAKIGKATIEAEIRKQVYPDGAYAQYSPNYQRVMLHDALWALRLGELNDDQFPPDIYQKVELSEQFLLQILDPKTGLVPNHGANDSTIVLPLNDADPNDFRPVIQSAHYLVRRERLFTEVDEDIFWLFGSEALESSLCSDDLHQKRFSAAVGGYYTLRGEDSWLMTRCAEYRARPHHADQLHVDFWWRGINIGCDAGTYLYNGAPPWRNGLATTAVHNTVTVDDQDQMTPYGRFLWLDWSRGQVHHHTDTYWEGSHDGYTRLKYPVSHRRGIMRLRDIWIVADELTSAGSHSYCLNWLVPHMSFQIDNDLITLQTHEGQFFIRCMPSKIVCKTADSASVQGWRSPYYGKKEPALSFSMTSHNEKRVVFWTILGPRPAASVLRGDGSLLVDGNQLNLGHDCLIECDVL